MRICVRSDVSESPKKNGSPASRQQYFYGIDITVVWQVIEYCRSNIVMKRPFVTLFLVTGVLALGADPTRGVRPRVDRTQYAVTMFDEFLAVAAERVPAEKVRRQFGPEVDSGYLVVEVGVYPRERSPIEVRPGDFSLRISRTRDILTPQGPKAIIEVSENYKPAVVELSAKALPEVSAYKPVAGYLYFQVPDKREGDYEYELEYKGQGAWMILPLHTGNPR